MTDAYRQLTLADVAREAGVSANTVSRVVNGRPGVSQATRENIRSIMDRLNYHPHIGARMLRGSRAGCIGVAVVAPPEIFRPQDSLLQWMFVKVASLFGRSGDYIAFDLNPNEACGDYARGLWEQLYRACLFVGPLHQDDCTMARVHASGMPYLALSRLDSLPLMNYVSADFESAAYQSAGLLLERGHRRIGLLMRYAGYQPGVERLRGYRRALKEAGLTFEPALVVDFASLEEDPAPAIRRLLAGGAEAIINASGWGAVAPAIEKVRAERGGRAFDLVHWAYSPPERVPEGTIAVVLLPTRDAASEGLEAFAEKVHGRRDKPVQIVKPPIIQSLG